MRREIVITFVALLLLIISTGVVFASDQDTNDFVIGIRAKYIESISANLSITNGTANVTTRVRDTDGDTTKISCVATLQKKSGASWKKVASWNKTTQANSLTLSKSKAVSKGKYRVKNVVKAYKGDKYETITKYSNIVAY